jgi:hypothetical protein
MIRFPQGLRATGKKSRVCIASIQNPDLARSASFLEIAGPAQIELEFQRLTSNAPPFIRWNPPHQES